MPENGDVPKEDFDKVMHIALSISNKNMIMGTDALESMGQNPTEGNNISLSTHPNSKKEADSIFKKLSEGGKVITPLSDTFCDAYFGMLTDKFGIQWMVNYEYKQ